MIQFLFFFTALRIIFESIKISQPFCFHFSSKSSHQNAQHKLQVIKTTNSLHPPINFTENRLAKHFPTVSPRYHLIAAECRLPKKYIKNCGYKSAARHPRVSSKCVTGGCSRVDDEKTICCVRHS